MATKAPKITYILSDDVRVVFRQNAQGTFRWHMEAKGNSFSLSPTDALTLLTSGIEPDVEV